VVSLHLEAAFWATFAQRATATNARNSAPILVRTLFSLCIDPGQSASQWFLWARMSQSVNRNR
jgi:hypothetical protein